MASIVRPTFVYYVGPDGRRCPRGTPGATAVRKKSSVWYAQRVRGYPPGKRIPLGVSNKAAAQRKLDDLQRAADRGRAGLPDRDAGRTPLADHLDGFGAALALGMASRLRGRAGTPASPRQVGLTVQRVRDMLGGCGFAHPADLDDAAPEKVAAYLQNRLHRPRADGGLSAQTAAFFLQEARRFVWWLSHRKRLAVRPDLFDDIPGFKPALNRVHARRAIPAAEVGAVLAAARTGPPVRGVSGPDRYALYLTACSTGYRAKELSALTPESFDPDGLTVALPGRRTKNKRAALIPVSPPVMAELLPFLRGKPAGRPLWPGKWVNKAALMLQRDLAVAGVPYVTDGPNGPEFADFHALRHSFVTALAAAGVGPKELQELARHSSPRLTVGVYTHTSRQQLADAVGRLGVPGAATEGAAALSRAELEALAGIALGLLGWVAGAVQETGQVAEA